MKLPRVFFPLLAIMGLSLGFSGALHANESDPMTQAHDLLHQALDESNTATELKLLNEAKAAVASVPPGRNLHHHRKNALVYIDDAIADLGTGDVEKAKDHIHSADDEVRTIE